MATSLGGDASAAADRDDPGELSEWRRHELVRRQIALRADTPVPQPVGDDHSLDPVGLAEILVALLEIGDESPVDRVER